MSANASVGRLPWTLKLGWGTGALGVALLLNGINLLVLFYLVTIVDLEPWLAGSIIFVSKLYDALSDPLIGVMSDKAAGPNGRRRPFLVWGALLCAASFFLLFTVPDFSRIVDLKDVAGFAHHLSFGRIPMTQEAGYQAIVGLYVLLVMLLYTTGYSIYNIPFIAMSAEMTDDYHERSSIQAYRTAFVSLGTLIAGTGSNFLLQAMGENQSTYTVMAALFSTVMFIAMMTAWRSTRTARLHAVTPTRLSPIAQISALVSNGRFLRLVGIKSAQLIGLFCVQAVIAFFILNAMGGTRMTIVIIGITSSVAVFFWNWVLIHLAKRIGKSKTLIVVSLASIALSLSYLFAARGDPDWHYAIRGFLNGLAFAGNLTIAMSMFADAIEWDNKKTGMRREGVYAAAYSFIEKLAGAAGPAIAGILLSSAGYDRSLAPLAAQSDEVVRALEIGVVWLPIGCYVIALLILTTYPSDDDGHRKSVS